MFADELEQTEPVAKPKSSRARPVSRHFFLGLLENHRLKQLSAESGLNASVLLRQMIMGQKVTSVLDRSSIPALRKAAGMLKSYGYNALCDPKMKEKLLGTANEIFLIAKNIENMFILDAEEKKKEREKKRKKGNTV